MVRASASILIRSQRQAERGAVRRKDRLGREYGSATRSGGDSLGRSAARNGVSVRTLMPGKLRFHRGRGRGRGKARIVTGARVHLKIFALPASPNPDAPIVAIGHKVSRAIGNGISAAQFL